MEIYSVPPFSTPLRYPGMSRETFFLRVPPRTLCTGVLFALYCCGLCSSQEPSQKSRALDSHIKTQQEFCFRTTYRLIGYATGGLKRRA